MDNSEHPKSGRFQLLNTVGIRKTDFLSSGFRIDTDIGKPDEFVQFTNGRLA
jgi:hypothetical protein